MIRGAQLRIPQSLNTQAIQNGSPLNMASYAGYLWVELPNIL